VTRDVNGRSSATINAVSNQRDRTSADDAEHED
jgi:hypothetical protein